MLIISGARSSEAVTRKEEVGKGRVEERREEEEGKRKKEEGKEKKRGERKGAETGYGGARARATAAEPVQP